MERMVENRSFIDNKPVKLSLGNIYKPRNLEDEVKRVFEIDQENMELLKKINIINRTKGSVDCWNLNFTDSQGFQTQEKAHKKIVKENEELYNRIQSIRKSSKMQEIPLLKNPKNSSRPRCFFELQVVETKQILGRIIIKLYTDVVPRTCENFLRFCSGFNGLSYKYTPFHRIIFGYLGQGGDVTKFNGSGGTSIYGGEFEDENFKLKHTGPGILSMQSAGRNANNSKFNLIFKKLEVLDGKNVVFGKVIYGLANIYKIESFGTKIGKPKKKIIISNCGLC